MLLRADKQQMGRLNVNLCSDLAAKSMPFPFPFPISVPSLFLHSWLMGFVLFALFPSSVLIDCDSSRSALTIVCVHSKCNELLPWPPVIVRPHTQDGMRSVVCMCVSLSLSVCGVCVCVCGVCVCVCVCLCVCVVCVVCVCVVCVVCVWYVCVWCVCVCLCVRVSLTL